MLNQLTIKNYALIDEMSVSFQRGFNILTGETGAGKSIILDAIGLILGERAKSDMIRQGASMAFVEAAFDVPASLFNDILKGEDGGASDGLLLRREVYRSGRSRSFANDSPITLNQLAILGDRLVDLHGQHEHQALLKAEKHLDYLDNFGADHDLRRQVRESYRRCRSLDEEIQSLLVREKSLKDQRELLEFQLQEIVRADPKPGEHESLEQEEKILRNCEKIFQTAKQINDLVYEGDGSVLEKLSGAEAILRDLSAVDAVFSKWTEETETIKIQIQELLHGVSGYADKIEFNPQRLEDIRERLSLFSRLKKKYGGSMETVLHFRKNAEDNLNRIETLQQDIGKLSTELEREKLQLSELCAALSRSRKASAEELQKKVETSLAELGLQDGIFCIQMNQKQTDEGNVLIDGKRVAVTQNGVDQVEFFISLNPGEPVKPLVQVASGGEVSRIMLALKSSLAEADAMPILIFDEIDSGISGRIAQVVGKKLKVLGKNHQVICITHLPQIASLGDCHFSVSKRITDNRTITGIQKIDQEDRVLEIARLIGGEKITEAAIANARELIQAQ
jgi:DNA repair protein RecN (Recombination protein N)